MAFSSTRALVVRLVSICIAVGLTDARLLRSGLTFTEYTRHFQRSYVSDTNEHSARRAIFDRRAALIAKHNAKTHKLWRAGFNKFTDRNDEELLKLRGRRGFAGVDVSGSGSLPVGLLDMGKSIDDAVEWSNLASLQDIKDQEGCGSCWAFAAANMLTAHYEIHHNQTKYFSPQHFVDCVPNPKKCGGTGGCKGATVELAMEYLESIGGLDNLNTLVDRPYYARDASAKCEPKPTSVLQRNSKKKHAHANIGLRSWSTLPSNEALPLMRALMEGPVAVSVAAEYWFFYDQGVFDSCEKDGTIDHAVLATGFGKDQEDNRFWNILNSWGNDWGERGYIRLYRYDSPAGDQKYCGTDTKPEDGIACEPYPDKVTICGMCGVLYDSVAPRFR